MLGRWAWALLVVTVSGCSSTVKVDFESARVGATPPGFATDLTGGGGAIAWVVSEDASAPSGRHVLAQTSADDTSYRFPLCVYEKLEARDVRVTVKVKPISGKVDEAAGIVLRYAPENYYIVRVNALEDNINLYETVKGKRTALLETPLKVLAGEWHTLGFEAKGRHLKASWDGKILAEIDDDSLAGPGKVGLWTKADSVSAFDDLVIEPLE